MSRIKPTPRFARHRNRYLHGVKSNLGFRMMCTAMNWRNKKNPPQEILRKAGIKPGFKVLDFGCGPGGHSIAAAELVGESGKVYALDIHPFASKMVAKTAQEKGLGNIETIQSDCNTGIDENTLDMVLLYDVYHNLDKPRQVLAELHRVLKPGGILSFSDHHLSQEEIVEEVEQTGLFRLAKREEKFLNFAKTGGNNGRT